MIQKLGAAMKKMAQRSMMRGNRGDAQAITDFGVTGMRSNLSNQIQNKITQHPTNTQKLNSEVYTQEATKNIKSNIANANVHQVKPAQTQNKKLGGSILDALGE